MTEQKKKWFSDLQAPIYREDWKEVGEICKEIASDDTGDTDNLTRLLASTILRLLLLHN